jgi:hypothetical protein
LYPLQMKVWLFAELLTLPLSQKFKSFRGRS